MTAGMTPTISGPRTPMHRLLMTDKQYIYRERERREGKKKRNRKREREREKKITRGKRGRRKSQEEGNSE
jgi:hypothetical protein